MKFEFIKKVVKSKRCGEVNILIPQDISSQIRYMESLTYHRIILANAAGFDFLKNMFLLIGEIKDKNTILYVPSNAHRQRK